MKNKLSIAIAVLFCASTTAHAQRIIQKTDRSEAVSIANASFAKCQIVVGSKDAASTHERNDKYDHLPLCERELNFQEEFQEERANGSADHQEEASVIL